MSIPAEHEAIVVAHKASAGAYVFMNSELRTHYYLFAHCYVCDMTPAYRLFGGFLTILHRCQDRSW